MKKMKFLGTLIAVTAFVVSGQRASAGEFGVLGGLSIFQPSMSYVSTSETVVTKGSTSSAFGVFYVSPLSLMFNLEIDALYVSKKAEFVYAGLLSADETFSYNAIQIPVILRASILPMGLLSVGAGAYYEIGMGSITDTDNVAGTSGTESYSTAGIKNNDFGLLGTVKVQIPIMPRTRILIDARYLYGLSEMSTAPSSYSIKDRYLQVFAGLGFYL